MNSLTTVAQLAPALARFRCMPPQWATYHTSPESASRMLRCTPEDVVQLTEYGLTSMHTQEGLRFDYFDVMNVGRFSNTGVTVPELNALALLRFSRQSRSTWLGSQQWALTVRLPEDDRTGKYKVRLPDFESSGITYVGGLLPWPIDGRIELSSSYAVSVEIEGVYDPIRDPVVHDIYEDIFQHLRSGAVIYQAISEPLRTEHEQAWQLGMADCMVTSRVLADRLRAAGVQSRARRGFILGLVGSEHAWCEVYEDSRWKSLDVTLAAMPTGLSGGSRLPSHDEFSSHCLGSRFNRCLPCVAEDASALMYDDRGQPLPMIGVVSATKERRHDAA